ncbi:oxygenase MpaB family protein [Nocardia lijiangensis]|uniref:oxygenase MpaB family protein n=1 Tax=Nocardia lijiangensis TaxID=299618 RepID=UPI00082C8E56|nr:oxygenase MpaB family protein [Nocardia lijiangensis]
MAHDNRKFLPTPQLFTEFPFKYAVPVLAPGDLRCTAAQRDSFRRFAQVGDPLADDVVAMIQRLPVGEGRRMFETAVAHGIDAVPDAPRELRAFFEQVEADPYWLDRGKIDRGARVVNRTGVWGGIAMGMFALMGGYLASRADKTLVGTGDLDAMAPRRLAETTQWWLDVTTPGALERHGIGYQSVLRVRLMHALVRSGMNRRPDWDYAAWDQPVNQVLTVGTLGLFSMANLVGAQALGLRFSAREKDAVFQLWRYIGFLLGIDPEILPTCETDTWRAFWILADTEFIPDEDSQRLAQALIPAAGGLFVGDSTPGQRAIRHLVTQYMVAYSRIVLGRTNSDFLGLPDSRLFQYAVLATAAINGALEVPRRVIPGATRLQENVGARVRTRLVRGSIARNGGDRTYARHDRFAADRGELRAG